MERFQDRRHAGRLLATKLEAYVGRHDVVVLALPRGGVPVAFEVAAFLRAPLEIFVVRKLGVPGHEEVAMGALASGGACVLDLGLIDALHISKSELHTVMFKEEAELLRRERMYGTDAQRLELRGRAAILVDDGLATGSTMRAAIAAARKLEPARVVVAVPVAEAATCRELSREADEVICAAQPEDFVAVGLWYADFTQVGDDEVRELLAASARSRERGARAFDESRDGVAR